MITCTFFSKLKKYDLIAAYFIVLINWGKVGYSDVVPLLMTFSIFAFCTTFCTITIEK